MNASEFLPHSGTMAFLDTIDQVDETGLTGVIGISGDDPFLTDGVVPVWISIEYMAQAIAAYAGYHARMRGEPVAVGFLLGCRKFECEGAGYSVGAELIVNVKPSAVGSNGLSAFTCSIVADNGTQATATLSVFKPADLGAYVGI